jgi:hypothetical protein
MPTRRLLLHSGHAVVVGVVGVVAVAFAARVSAPMRIAGVVRVTSS